VIRNCVGAGQNRTSYKLDSDRKKARNSELDDRGKKKKFRARGCRAAASCSKGTVCTRLDSWERATKSTDPRKEIISSLTYMQKKFPGKK